MRNQILVGAFVLVQAAVVRRSSTDVSLLLSGSDPLCGEGIKETCAAMQRLHSTFMDHHHHNVDPEGLAEFMASSATDMHAFLQGVGLPAREFSCTELCIKTLEYATEDLKLQLPPKSGVVCTDPACEDFTDVSKGAMGVLAEAELQKEHDAHGATLDAFGMATSFVPPKGRKEHKPDVQVLYTDETKPADKKPLSYTVEDMTRQLAVLFDIHFIESGVPADFESSDAGPEASSSLVQTLPLFGPKIRADRYAFWHRYASKGAALLALAIKRVEARQDIIDRFFGAKVPASKVKVMFQQMLRTILDLQIKRGEDDTCAPGSGTLAFVRVWHSPFTQEFVRSDRAGPDGYGEYIVHVCEEFWNVVDNLSYRYGTLVHESAHHWGPTDVALENGNTAYGKWNTLELVKEFEAAHPGAGPEAATGPTHPIHNADNYMQAVLMLAADELEKPINPKLQAALGRSTCKDDEAAASTFTLNGHPGTCLDLLNSCADPTYGKAITQACRKSCGDCTDERLTIVPNPECNTECGATEFEDVELVGTQDISCYRCGWTERVIGHCAHEDIVKVGWLHDLCCPAYRCVRMIGDLPTKDSPARRSIF